MSNSCHGCKGNGWVSPNGNNAVLCPVCIGKGIYESKKKPVTIKNPFTLPYKPYQPYQPNPYFYGPSITCNITSTENPEKLANMLIDRLNKATETFKSAGVTLR